MSWDFKSSPRIVFWLLLLLTATIANAASAEGIDLSNHPVLQKYPSPEDIAEQVRQLKATQPGVVEDILADFDLSIRSSLTLEPPPTPEQRRHLQRLHIPLPEVTPGRTYRRSSIESGMAELRNDPDGVERLEFYESHFDELVFDDQAHVGLIMMYVLAFGWEDWSAWQPQDERLTKAREQFPELHRINALSMLQVLRHKPAIGVLLWMTINDDDLVAGRPSRVAIPSAVNVLRTMGNYEDVLQFYVDWGLDPATTNDTRWKLWTEIQMITQRMVSKSGGKNSARAFWERYLESDVPTLWYCAQKALDRPLPEDPNWLNKAQSDWNYQHERDPKVRRAIDLRLKIAEIRKDVDPVTNRISMEQWAEIQALNAELKRLEELDDPPGPPAP